MEFRVLAIGDVTSEEGTAHLRRHLPGFKDVYKRQLLVLYVLNGGLKNPLLTFLAGMALTTAPVSYTHLHRGAKPPRRCGRLGEISLLSPG